MNADNIDAKIEELRHEIERYKEYQKASNIYYYVRRSARLMLYSLEGLKYRIEELYNSATNEKKNILINKWKKTVDNNNILIVNINKLWYILTTEYYSVINDIINITKELIDEFNNNMNTLLDEDNNINDKQKKGIKLCFNNLEKDTNDLVNEFIELNEKMPEDKLAELSQHIDITLIDKRSKIEELEKELQLLIQARAIQGKINKDGKKCFDPLMAEEVNIDNQHCIIYFINKDGSVRFVGCMDIETLDRYKTDDAYSYYFCKNDNNTRNIYGTMLELPDLNIINHRLFDFGLKILIPQGEANKLKIGHQYIATGEYAIENQKIMSKVPNRYGLYKCSNQRGVLVYKTIQEYTPPKLEVEAAGGGGGAAQQGGRRHKKYMNRKTKKRSTVSRKMRVKTAKQKRKVRK